MRAAEATPGRYYCGMTNEDQADLKQKSEQAAPVKREETALPDEYDRRGVKLPARARVGGIIIPQ